MEIERVLIGSIKSMDGVRKNLYAVRDTNDADGWSIVADGMWLMPYRIYPSIEAVRREVLETWGAYPVFQLQLSEEEK